jgi:tetratricopeptide (TPR) repeat protein
MRMPLPGKTSFISALMCAFVAVTISAQEDGLAAKSRAANQMLLAGRYTEAIKIYRELVAALPDNPGLRFNLGLALEKGGQPAAAIPELNQATRAQPDFAPAWFLLGLAYQQLGKPREAIAPLRKAASLDGADSRTQLELADAELAAGQPRDSAEGFRALAARHPEMAKAWQGLGLSYLALGERAFTRLAETAPSSGYWHALAARAREGEGRYPESLALYQDAIRAAPDVPGLHTARASIYRQTNHPDWASVEESRESAVPKADCGSHKAACAYLAGEWLSSLAEAEKSPTTENLYWASLACGTLAEQSFQRVASLPPSAEIHELLAESNQRRGRRVEAVEEWRKALAMAPDDKRLQGRLAESLIRDRKYEDAERLLQPLVAGQPENGEWQYLLGDTLFEQRRADGALPHLIAAARLMPGHLPASEVLGRAYLALGQLEKAVARLEKARPLDDGAISFALSSAYRRLGREPEARAALARYQQLTRQKGSATAPAEPGAIPAP